MITRNAFFISITTLFILLSGLSSKTHLADEADCSESGDYSYICGLNSPEDLVKIPDTNWVVASGFSGTSALYLVDAKSKSWREIYPASAPLARQNMSIYANCPGSPNPNNFTAHGLNIRKTSDTTSILNVVGHGEREAIEVFEIDISNAEPAITWIGCVMTPDNLAANSVTSLDDGTLLATIPLHSGFTIDDAFKGKATGAAYKWSPGDATFRIIKGTELTYPNGIEISNDGREFYIASSGDIKVLAFSNTNPAKLLRTSKSLDIVPDNLRWGVNGQLLTAGMTIESSSCKTVAFDGSFTFEDLYSCPRAFKGYAFKPSDLSVSVLSESEAQPQFTNITMVIEVNDELWFGTFAGDRLAYKKTK